MNLRIQCVCIDSHDPAHIATFWEAALGWRRTYEDDGQVAVEPPAGSPEDGVVPDRLFVRVLEDKTSKDRLHFDLRPDDQVAEVWRLIELGAQRVSVGQGPEVSWAVLAGPDGNEFCVLEPLVQ